MPILIIYASPHGSTRAIAERISSRIASQIPPTEVHALSDIDPATLSSYTAIVIGSAVHKVAWLHDATTFVHANSTALANLPVFAFSVGAPAGMPKFVRARFERSEEKRLEGAVEKELKSGKATLEAHKLFNGKFEREDGDVDLLWGFEGINQRIQDETLAGERLPTKSSNWGKAMETSQRF